MITITVYGQRADRACLGCAAPPHRVCGCVWYHWRWIARMLHRSRASGNDLKVVDGRVSCPGGYGLVSAFSFLVYGILMYALCTATHDGRVLSRKRLSVPKATLTASASENVMTRSHAMTYYYLILAHVWQGMPTEQNRTYGVHPESEMLVSAAEVAAFVWNSPPAPLRSLSAVCLGTRGRNQTQKR